VKDRILGHKDKIDINEKSRRFLRQKRLKRGEQAKWRDF
jgi:hypothetical protein